MYQTEGLHLGYTNCDEEFVYHEDTKGGVGNDEGNKLKSCRRYKLPTDDICEVYDQPRWYFSESNIGSDDFGFAALPGGRRYSHGSYSDELGGLGNWWASTEETSLTSISTTAWFRELSVNSDRISRNVSSKNGGMSVRCIRDPN